MVTRTKAVYKIPSWNSDGDWHRFDPVSHGVGFKKSKDATRVRRRIPYNVLKLLDLFVYKKIKFIEENES